MQIKDNPDLAWQDWLGTAGFDRPEDGLGKISKGLRRFYFQRKMRLVT